MLMEVLEQLEIRQHNAITSARYDYTATQLDILFYLLSKLNKDDQPSQTYQIHVKDIEAVTGRQWNYQQLKEATADMGSRMFEVNTKDSYEQIWIFQKVRYERGKGYFIIKLAEDIRPYLFELKNNFTSYQLHSALKLTSKYAKRIYQLASQWKDIGETKAYSLSDFKVMLKLKDPKGREPEQFQKISQLKERVLDISVRQINEFTDLKISYHLVKQGRAFTAIKFYINAQSAKQLQIPFEKTVEDGRKQNVLQVLENFGIKDSKIIQRILADETLIDGVFKFNYDLKTGKKKAEKSVAGLLLTVLGLKTTKAGQ